MKPLLLILSFFLLIPFAHAQTGREVDGKVIDTTKLGVPGASVILKSDKGDSTTVVTDATGKFVFPSVGGTKFTLAISSIGYQGIIKHYTLDNDTKPAVLDAVILKSE